MASPRIAIIIYTMYGHIGKMAESVKSGIVAKGGNADILQVPETLSDDILVKMKAPTKPDFPIIKNEDLLKYDAFLFGIPTRFGNMPAQLKAFWDATGRLWKEGSLKGKYAGMFVSTQGPGGGQEATIMDCLSTMTHHGIIFVPFGYEAPHSIGFKPSIEEVHGGSPWGAGTFAMHPSGPTKLELEMAKMQGMVFYDVVSRVRWESKQIV